MPLSVFVSPPPIEVGKQLAIFSAKIYLNLPISTFCQFACIPSQPSQNPAKQRWCAVFHDLAPPLPK